MPKLTIEMLTGDMAKSLSALAKQHGARVQRLAQGQKELGRCKCVIHFDQFPGWADNARAMRTFIDGDLMRWKLENKRGY
jgi:hypothetical protein